MSGALCICSLSPNFRLGLIKSEAISPIVFAITKLINIGLFSNSLGLGSSHTNFFAVILPRIRTHASNEIYFEVWRDIFTELPTNLLSKVLESLFSLISTRYDDLDPSEEARSHVKLEARLVSNIIGSLEGDDDEKWISVSSVLLSRAWSIYKARVLICWVSISDGISMYRVYYSFANS